MALTTTDARTPCIGVFGGAFDPPHRAHVALVEAALAQFDLDAVHVLPTGAAWHKPRPLSAPEHRLAMTRLAFDALPAVRVDPRELQRDGPTYTVDTLRELQLAEPTAMLHLLIGADQAAALTGWHDWPALLELAIVCVAFRAGNDGGQAVFDAENPPSELAAGRFRRLAMPALAISSTEIRRRVAGQRAIDALVAPAVARYIAAHHLYQSDPA